MNGLPYYKAYPRDFIEGTVGMSFELKATYRLLLDLIYMRAGGLPDDARYISGILGCSVRAWNKHRSKLIEAGKIKIENGIISNFRADKEIETLGKFQEKQRENRSRPNKNNGLQSPRFDHSRVQITEPDTEPYKKKDSPPSAVTDFVFVGNVIRLKRDQRDKWAQSYPAIPDLMAELQKADDYYTANPLNDPKKWIWPVSRWLDRAHKEALEKSRPVQARNWRQQPEYRGVL